MKTASLTYPTYHIIDTAPLAVRYEILAQAVLAFVMAGRLSSAMRVSYKIIRLIRTLTKLEAQNVQLRRKLDMLSHKPWRELVLRELGGLRKLKLWETAKERIKVRAEAPIQLPPPQEPAWLYTAERIAESERLKEWARDCARACTHPLIFRDRVRMDFDGLFRLAPFPRGEQAAPRIKVYSQTTISDYVFNAVPFRETEGFGPAVVWPVEFYAAMAIEAQDLEGRDSTSLHSPRCKTGTITRTRPQSTKPEMDPVSSVCEQTQERDERKEESVPTLTLRKALPDKLYRAIFDP